MPWDPGLAERVAGALLALGVHGARQKGVFGGRGFLLGKSTFVVVWDDGILVKMPAAEYPGALALPGVVPFAPDGGRPMGTWVVVGADAVAEDPELREWVACGVRAVR